MALLEGAAFLLSQQSNLSPASQALGKVGGDLGLGEGAPHFRNAAKGFIFIGDMPPSIITWSSGGTEGESDTPGGTGDHISLHLPEISVGNGQWFAHAFIAAASKIKGMK